MGSENFTFEAFDNYDVSEYMYLYKSSQNLVPVIFLPYFQVYVKFAKVSFIVTYQLISYH